MRFAAVSIAALLLAACGSAPRSDSSPGNKAPKPSAAKVKITQFYAADPKIPRGLKGNLCYGVENAKRMELSPAVEQVWPALTRCFQVSPAQNTTYTLTAYGEDGSVDTKTVSVSTAAAPPRLYDLSVNRIAVAKGEEVQVCFKVENTTRVKASPGRLDTRLNCVFDKPSKTTTYKITALGGDREMDSGTVTVKVH